MSESTLVADVVKAGPKFDTAMDMCVETLRHITDRGLDPAMNRRLMDLGERKESLSPEEHEELLSLVSFGERRTIERLEAQAALKRLTEALPALAKR